MEALSFKLVFIFGTLYHGWYARQNRWFCVRRTMKRAFTLIELLVVVAVLVLLMSLLMPVLQGALDAAKEAQCRRGSANLGIAFHSYSAANNQCIPLCQTADLTNGGAAWTWQLTFVKGGYVPSRPVSGNAIPPSDAFTCPLDPRLKFPNWPSRRILSCFFMPVVLTNDSQFALNSDTYSGDITQPGTHTLSVGVKEPYTFWWYWNSSNQLAKRSTRPPPMPHMTMSRIEDTAGTLMLVEGLGNDHEEGYAYGDESWIPNPSSWSVSKGTPSFPSSRFVRRHRGDQGVLMCDGSVKMMKVEDTAGPAYSAGFHGNNLSWDDTCIGAGGWPQVTWWDQYSGTLWTAGIHGYWTIVAGD